MIASAKCSVIFAVEIQGPRTVFELMVEWLAFTLDIVCRV